MTIKGPGGQGAVTPGPDLARVSSLKSQGQTTECLEVITSPLNPSSMLGSFSVGDITPSTSACAGAGGKCIIGRNHRLQHSRDIILI